MGDMRRCFLELCLDGYTGELGDSTTAARLGISASSGNHVCAPTPTPLAPEQGEDAYVARTKHLMSHRHEGGGCGQS